MNLNIILIFLITFFIFYIRNNRLTEFFNQDKNIQEIANDKINLVKNINLITLNKISKYFTDISYNLYKNPTESYSFVKVVNNSNKTKTKE